MKVLCVVGTEDRLFFLKRAIAEFSTKCLDFHADVYSVMETRQEFQGGLERLSEYDFAFLYFHGGAQFLENFSGIWNVLKENMPVFFLSSLVEEVAELMKQSSLSKESYQNMVRYFEIPQEENYLNVVRLMANELGGAFPISERVKLPLDGYYQDGNILTEEEGKQLLQQVKNTSKPVVGLILHQNSIVTENRAHIDKTIALVTKQGAIPLPVFTKIAEDEDKKGGIVRALQKYFLWEGKPLIGSLIVMTGFSMNYMSEKESYPENSVLEILGVPTMQMMVTYYTKKEYEEKYQGLDSMMLGTSVFQPEMDGQIITVPSATTEISEEGEILRRIAIPMEDRIQKVTKLAINWATLGKKPNREKKIAILFHSLPGNDRIGCAEGLDSFQTVFELLDFLKRQGIFVERDFANGQEIIEQLTQNLTNDLTYKKEEDIPSLARDLISQEICDKWWQRNGEGVQKELEKRWGTPPGNVMVQKQKIIVPGIQNGNVFMGIQPSRAFGEKAKELYHSTEAPPPYSYLAFYRWLEEIFCCDVVCHIGTHGTVEWLPGKEIGISKDCYPDFCMGSIPHLYLYHIGVTGEGIQAKRRSHAAILDHLMPSMQESGTYGELTALEEAIREYEQAKQFSKGQIPNVQNRIQQLLLKLNILEDVHLTMEDFLERTEESIQKIHLWMGTLKNSVTTDGLHVFGKIPQGKLFHQLLRMLVRVPNGKIPSIYDGVLIAMGEDPEEIARQLEIGQKQSVYDNGVKWATKLSEELGEKGYLIEEIETLIQKEQFSGDTKALKEVLSFLATTVKEKVEKTKEEMTYFLEGIEGRLIPPGKGGNPTRGNVEILPTGRNFHGGDPTEIPSRSAFSVGEKLAQKMLQRFQGEREGYPESVAMIIWAGNTLKTCGEDFAQALYLMGVRPVYLGNTQKVLDVEPIPLEELQRPRLDVTLRVSGLFRDMYPNLITLMDRAVNCIVCLEEDVSQNYVKKHFEEDVSEFLKSYPEMQAENLAKVRVFSDAKGNYGAGVSHLIESKQWDTYEDLADVYSNFSGHGYTATLHGERMLPVFEKRLSQVEMTIKNESSVELDIFSSDDFYSYHGGLIACVTKHAKKAPLAMTGHTEDMRNPQIRTVEEEVARIVRTKTLHPVWVEGLKRHGYKGAQEIVAALNHLFGWDATAKAGKDWMYEEVAKTFLLDEQMRKWIEEVNPWAIHSISERLLEAHQRKMWEAEESLLQQIREIYLHGEGLMEETK